MKMTMLDTLEIITGPLHQHPRMKRMFSTAATLSISRLTLAWKSSENHTGLPVWPACFVAGSWPPTSATAAASSGSCRRQIRKAGSGYTSIGLLSIILNLTLRLQPGNQVCDIGYISYALQELGHEAPIPAEPRIDPRGVLRSRTT